METPSYIASNIDELFENSPEYIQNMIHDREPDNATITLSVNYNIPVGSQTALSNLITFILIGALHPDDVVQALQDILGLTSEDAVKLATDLEHSILEKARISLFTKTDGEVKTLEFQGQKSKEELRKEILDTTKRESGLEKSQGGLKPTPKKPSVITPGSRSQLLEQLQILGTIPNDEEIAERLHHIQEQISAIKQQEEDNTLDSNIALKSFMFGEKGKEVATPDLKPATYSTAPTKYNVDPYREVAEI